MMITISQKLSVTLFFSIFIYVVDASAWPHGDPASAECIDLHQQIAKTILGAKSCTKKEDCYAVCTQSFREVSVNKHYDEGAFPELDKLEGRWWDRCVRGIYNCWCDASRVSCHDSQCVYTGRDGIEDMQLLKPNKPLAAVE